MKRIPAMNMTIGKLAAKAGVGVETVRFYERKGLISPAGRRRSGYRQYGTEAVRRLRFVCRAKQLGFTLREIRELLDLRMKPGGSCDDVRQRALNKANDLHQRIEDLKRMHTVLHGLIQHCDGEVGGEVDHCPILAALDRDDCDD